MVIVINAAASVERGFAGNFTHRDMSPSWGNKSLTERWGVSTNVSGVSLRTGR
jgi:hypothetical protein